jgi:hypothetical protein
MICRTWKSLAQGQLAGRFGRQASRRVRTPCSTSSHLYYLLCWYGGIVSMAGSRPLCTDPRGRNRYMNTPPRCSSSPTFSGFYLHNGLLRALLSTIIHTASQTLILGPLSHQPNCYPRSDSTSKNRRSAASGRGRNGWACLLAPDARILCCLRSTSLFCLHIFWQCALCVVVIGPPSEPPTAFVVCTAGQREACLAYPISLLFLANRIGHRKPPTRIGCLVGPAISCRVC